MKMPSIYHLDPSQLLSLDREMKEGKEIGASFIFKSQNPSQLFSLPSLEQRSGAAIKYAKAEKLVAADNLFPIINKPIFKPSPYIFPYIFIIPSF